MFAETGSAAPWLALALICAVFVVFLLEVRASEVVALAGAATALALGLIGVEDILAAIANPAPATIGAMFVLSAALVRTGVLDLLSLQLLRGVATRPVMTLGGFFLVAGAVSAFMNNTPVVMVLIPVVYTLAREMGLAASRFLIPLSFVVILGGTCSLIGTSSNLLVDGVARDLGLAPFSLFEIAPLGLAVAAAGGVFLLVAAPRLLPDRRGIGDRQNTLGRRAWNLEVAIPPGSSLVGRQVLSVAEFRRGGGRVIDLVRDDHSHRLELADLRLKAGDRVVLKTSGAEVMTFREGHPSELLIAGAELHRARRSSVIEVLIGPEAAVVGHRLEDLGWRRKYSTYPIALHRKGEAMVLDATSPTLRPGDIVLLDGPPESIERLVQEDSLVALAPFEARPYRRRKAPIALAVVAAVVLGAALGLAPILALAIVGVAVVLFTNCIDPDEGIGAIDGRLLLLVVSMLVLGSALEKSGAMAMIINALAPVLGSIGPLWALAVVYAVTSILTEVVTNNAVAVVMTPIAAGVAVQLGLDPRSFVVAVMFGASASFATPIGYQTNTMVYTAGGYRFADFLRIGIPMNLIAGSVTVLVAPLIWPL